MIELKNEEICHFTILLDPKTKKNNQKIVPNPKTGKPMIVQNEIYKRYEHDAAWFMPHIATINRPVNIRAVFYRRTRMRVDLTNLLEALNDILVKYGVLEDDSYKIVTGVDGSEVRFDKTNPRTEVWIYESRNT